MNKVITAILFAVMLTVSGCVMVTDGVNSIGWQNGKIVGEVTYKGTTYKVTEDGILIKSDGSFWEYDDDGNIVIKI